MKTYLIALLLLSLVCIQESTALSQTYKLTKLSVSKLKKMASGGDPKAAIALASKLNSSSQGDHYNPLLGMKFLKSAADDSQDSEAMRVYADWLKRGYAGKADGKLAKEYYKKSALHGSREGLYRFLKMNAPQAEPVEVYELLKQLNKEHESNQKRGYFWSKCEIGVMEFFGYGTQKNKESAAANLKQCRISGNGDSKLRHIGRDLELLLFLESTSDSRSADQIVEEWNKYRPVKRTGMNPEVMRKIEEAAKSKDRQMQFYLAYLYIVGFNHPYRDFKDIKIPGYGEELLRKVASQSFPLASLELAIYLDKKGSKEAAKYLIQAANTGLPLPQLMLVLHYWEGSGKNEKQAKSWAEKAANSGNSSGQYLLGQIYLDKERGFYDPPQALKWLGKAAESGHIDAELHLANLLRSGEHVSKDYEKAFQIYKRLAEQKPKGHPRAMTGLALMYLNGEGRPRAIKRAELIFANAVTFYAEPEALYQYARLKKNELSSKTIIDFLYKASEQGHKDAPLELARMLEEKESNHFNDSTAYHYFYQAALRKNRQALLEVAHRLKTGKGVKQRKGKALAWYQMAARYEVEGAKEAAEELEEELNERNQKRYKKELARLEKIMDPK